MLTKLGKYEILGILGRGSMGVVYKGIDPNIGKLVAIKTMNQKILQHSEMQQRFYREGNILGQLQHKNIINVYNVGVDGDTCYIAMEYLEGTSLDRLLKRREKLSYARILNTLIQVCEGVNAAHKRSIIHRDLKPANIFLLDEEHVKVLDFGVAHFQNSQLTNSGMLLGTINYIAPEQITGLKLDIRADIFSIGVILYELLGGRNPFVGKNISQTMVKIVNEIPPPIPGLTKDMAAILDRALQKDRERRYPEMQQLAQDLERQLRAHTLNEPARKATPPEGLDVAKSHNEMFHKMVAERVEAIHNHIRREELELAENLFAQLQLLEETHPELPKLEEALNKARKRVEQRRKFLVQLTHDTLLKANEMMADRHFVSAVELCEKVLKMDAKNQDAKVIKANCIHKLEQFLAQQKG